MQNNSDHGDQKKINGSRVYDRKVLTPGKSIVYENYKETKDRIDKLIKEHITEIVLDCKSVEYMDSAGLEFLLNTHEELRDQGGALKITGLNAVCRDILMATRLINSLYVYEDIYEAVTSRL